MNNKILQESADDSILQEDLDRISESDIPLEELKGKTVLVTGATGLIENGIKYNKPNGKLWVTVSEKKGHPCISVKDTGIGVPMKYQSRIFERFFRVDKSHSKQTGGTGLGLAIVRNIILMHHGTIKVHSEENIGTTFTMRIPLNYVENQQ